MTMSTLTSSLPTRTLFTLFAATKSLPVDGSTTVASRAWTSASVSGMRGSGGEEREETCDFTPAPQAPQSKRKPLLESIDVHAAPHAVRDHGPTVRERSVPHRPHHGVHPGRRVGALPADAGARRAFRVRRRHAWRADHAEGGER